MRFSVGLLASLAASVLASSSGETINYVPQFRDFIAKFNKSYTVDNVERFNNFVATLKRIDAINADNTTSWTAHVDQFADLSLLEWSNIVTAGHDISALPPRPVRPRPESPPPPPAQNVGAPPAAWDWRNYNGSKSAVNPPEAYIPGCNANWAYATTSAIEGVHKKSNGTLVRLSMQQLLECQSPLISTPDTCILGAPQDGYRSANYKNNVNLESAYPRAATISATCNFVAASSARGARIGNFVQVTSFDEVALKAAVYQQPVSCVMNFVRTSVWNAYSGGILDADPGLCPGLGDADYFVTVVGYGTSATGIDYWILKNNLGTTYGDGGYMYMRRGTNLCGISEDCTWPYYAKEPAPGDNSEQQDPNSPTPHAEL